MGLTWSLQPFAPLGKMSVDTCRGMGSGSGSGLLPLETRGSASMLHPLNANLGTACPACIWTCGMLEGGCLALIKCLKLSPVIPFLCL